MSDLTFRIGRDSFTVRAACIILRENHLLCATNINDKAYYTIGGRTHFNETTSEAAVREALEETGYSLQIERLLFVQEWFSAYDGARRHHITFYYLMKGDTSGIIDGAPTDQKDFETLHWLSLDALKDINLVPGFLKTALFDLPSSPVHIVSSD